MSHATDKQIDYILALAGRDYLSQVAKVTRVHMTQRSKRGGLTKTEASQIIDDLLAQKEAGMIE